MAEKIKVKGNRMQDMWHALGKHIILEVFTDDKELLDNENAIVNIIKEACEYANVELLNIATHKFSPHGVTAVALLAESHLSIHTWPEYGYAAVDIYTCGGWPEKAMEKMIEKLGAYFYDMKMYLRGEYSMVESIINNRAEEKDAFKGNTD